MNADRNPDYDANMDDRLTRLEESVAKLTLDLVELRVAVDVLKKTSVTKADLLEVKNSLIMWIVGAILVSQFVPAMTKILLQ